MYRAIRVGHYMGHALSHFTHALSTYATNKSVTDAHAATVEAGATAGDTRLLTRILTCTVTIVMRSGDVCPPHSAADISAGTRGGVSHV